MTSATDIGGMHLAQLNVARARHALDDPRMADFIDNLDRVNAIAERSPGYLWRLQDEVGNATGIAFGGDPGIIVNMSVWENPQAFQNFVWNTLHKQFYARRDEWFGAMESNHMVMWWVPAGHTPTVAEAAERLEHLDKHGPTEHAFGWESLPDQQAWRQARCA
jgi:heme-degrading monooxygenase HmoA